MIAIRRAIRPMLMVLAFLSLVGQVPAMSQVCRVSCRQQLETCLSRSLDPTPCYAEYFDCIVRRGGW